MGYDKVNLGDVTDQAAEHGFGELQEARFPREDVGTEASGLAHIKVKPGQRQPFADAPPATGFCPQSLPRARE